ncbi:hypothetical protein QVD17_01399 [Tagetes erecta]|uniref:Lipid desaturase domain-containing protein n=1 Tax=Tagetes erecta TaxID=13708 RepID=A0AAD8P6R0_TARER|nr:hypothetical protein QVD17_01399 [Tagetes erecta]
MSIQSPHLTTSVRRHRDDHNIHCATTTPIKTNVTPSATSPKTDDPSLKSTWSHRVWVATGCTTILASLASAVVGSVNEHIWIKPILSGFIGYLFADLGSGVYHWAIDNYGDASTPVFGFQIDAFQYHHKWPWAITISEFANRLHVIGRIITFTVTPLYLIFHDQPVVMGFVGVASGCIMFGVQIHAWAHGTKRKLPWIVVALQDVGVFISPSHHAAHHQPPYSNSYCIVSGVWNRFLDEYKVFEALEMVLFLKLGLRPRSWSEPNSDRRKEAEESPVM